MIISNPKVYTITHLTPANNQEVARTATGRYAVSLSGGLASALAAERAISRYGREAVLLWFADTQEEDEDLYRFLHDLMARWGGLLYYYTDGRRPLDIAEEKQIIPCNQLAPCSFELKVRPYRTFIQAMRELPTVMIGLDYWESRRLKTTRTSYAKAIPEAIVEYPLLWPQVERRPLVQVCRDDWQIEPPRLYVLGFPHNNCGGACVRQGRGEWERLYKHFPERYAAREEWEQAQRAKGGARANWAFCAVQERRVKRSLPLAEIRARLESGEQAEPGGQYQQLCMFT
jgi:3'-phosphoadenosine 5'-phosphosulfate sulfotransferase (PAPS reductase)/FAD synthetase